MRIFLVVCLAVLCPIAGRSALADLNTDLAGCAAITKSAERLACYDALAEQISPGARQANPTIAGSGKWDVSTEVSPVDDSTNAYLGLDAEDTIAGKFGGTTRPRMIVRCKENHTDIYVAWDEFMGSDTTAVLTRLDKEPAKTLDWDISTNSKSTFHPSAVAFAKEMLKHDTLLVRTTPYGESPVSTTFDIRGLNAVIGQVQKACHWQ